MGRRLTRVAETRRRAVERGRPYLASIAGVLAVIAVIVSGSVGVLIGLALAGMLLYGLRELGPADRASAQSSDHGEDLEQPGSVAAGGAAAQFDDRLSRSPQLGFDETLSGLIGLVGRRVQVLLYAAEDRRAVGEIHGILAEGRDIAQDDEGEVILFLIDGHDGDVAGAFALASTEFNAGVQLVDPDALGVAFTVGASVVWVFDEGLPEDHRRQRSRGAQR